MITLFDALVVTLTGFILRFTAGVLLPAFRGFKHGKRYK